MTIEFSSFDLSPQIQFEAVTFEMPVEFKTMQKWTEGDESSYYYTETAGDDIYTDFTTGSLGNEHAFILASPTHLDDQFRMFGLCAKDENDPTDDVEAFADGTDCSFPLNSSMLIYSFAQHITMYEWTIFNTTDDGTLYFAPNGSTIVFRTKNHRKIYSVTVGKLSWQTTDLAQVYDAACEVNGACNGLCFPLTNANQHVAVGESYIPDIPNFYSVSSFGQSAVLVSSRKQLAHPFWSRDTNYDIDLIYPPIYPVASDSLPWNLTGADCSAFGSGFINDAIQRHVYSKDPLQPAYTTGL